jgi:hypothetical protein
MCAHAHARTHARTRAHAHAHARASHTRTRTTRARACARVHGSYQPCTSTSWTSVRTRKLPAPTSGTALARAPARRNTSLRGARVTRARAIGRPRGNVRLQPRLSTFWTKARLTHLVVLTTIVTHFVSQSLPDWQCQFGSRLRHNDLRNQISSGTAHACYPPCRRRDATRRHATRRDGATRRGTDTRQEDTIVDYTAEFAQWIRETGLGLFPGSTWDERVLSTEFAALNV